MKRMVFSFRLKQAKVLRRHWFGRRALRCDGRANGCNLPAARVGNVRDRPLSRRRGTIGQSVEKAWMRPSGRVVNAASRFRRDGGGGNLRAILP